MYVKYPLYECNDTNRVKGWADAVLHAILYEVRSGPDGDKHCL